MRYESIREFITALGSKNGTPGGGASTALVALNANALVKMVANLTLNKKKYAHVQTEIKAILSTTTHLESMLMEMIDNDMSVFDELMDVYRLKPESDEEREKKEKLLEEKAKACVDVPFNIALASSDILRVSRTLAEKGNRNVLSDVFCAAQFAMSAFEASRCNMRVNYPLIKDEVFKEGREEALNKREEAINAYFSYVKEVSEKEIYGNV